ncbi:MAG: hypothetical protein PHZ25_03785 [Candidatus Pacebacteria bacterium]|nr:hypothetical protein [Candidatus Paceibacterota bacterium]
MRKKIYVSIAAVLIGISLFYSGVKYGESKKTTAFSGNMGARLNGSGFQNGTKNQGGGMIMGEIISKDEESITVKLQTGGSKIIFTPASTPIFKSTEGQKEDLVIGDNVSISGKSNSDGSFTADSVQIKLSSSPDLEKKSE